MNPEQLAKSGTEHAEQMALFCWANMAMKVGFELADMMESYAHKLDEVEEGTFKSPVSELEWLHAIPNAGARGNKVAASQLKAEGVKAGVADIFWPYSWNFGNQDLFCGLYIELKRKNGKASDFSKKQLEFAKFVRLEGYKWAPAFGWQQAAKHIRSYYEEAGEIIALDDRHLEVYKSIEELDIFK